MPDEHTQAVLSDIHRTLTKRRQQETLAIMAFFGGQQGWFDACRRRNFADQERQLARVLVRLLRAAADAGPLRCRDADMRRLEADPQVLAFWRSVAASGPDGWREERRRVKEVENEAVRSPDPVERLLALDVNAVRSLLPTYRAWGRMLMGA